MSTDPSTDKKKGGQVPSITKDEKVKEEEELVVDPKVKSFSVW